LKIIREAYSRAKRILEENEAKMHELTECLLKKETMTGEEFMKVLDRSDPNQPC
jgi:cell division protease FtsH